MNDQHWLDLVRQRLARQALSPVYVQRLIEELSDHLQDLKEENMETDASSRLGQPQQVANAAVIGYRRRSFLGRHPVAAFLVFAISPVVSLIGAFAVVFGACQLLDAALPADDFGSFLRNLGPQGRRMLPYVLSVMFPMIPCALGAVLHCKLARRLGLSGRWVGLSCAVMAVLGGVSIWTAKFSEMPGQSCLRFGLGIPVNIVDLPHMVTAVITNPLRLVQFLIPLAVGCWFFWRQRTQRRLRLA